MTNHGSLLFAVVLLIAATVPAGVSAQSDASAQETQQLQKQLEEMRAQLDKMQARLDQLESAKRESSTSQLGQALTAAPASQEGTIHTTQPLPQGPTSPQVGGKTSVYRQFSEDNLAAPRYDNIPLDPKYQRIFLPAGYANDSEDRRLRKDRFDL